MRPISRISFVIQATGREAGLAGWFPLASDAAGRTRLVSEVEASPEATQLVVSTIYQDILGRAPDTGGLAYWTSRLQQGVSKSTVLAAVLGSDEFFGRMQSYAKPINTSDPNVAAATFISEAHLFKSQPTAVPAAPPVVFVGSGGDNSGFDIPPGGDTLGNIFGVDNSGGSTVIADTWFIPPSVTDMSALDNSCYDNSTTDVTDGSSTDCSYDTGVPDTTGFSGDTSATDNSFDPSGGF